MYQIAQRRVEVSIFRVVLLLLYGSLPFVATGCGNGDPSGQLFEHAREGNPRGVRAALKSGGKVDHDVNGATPLIAACLRAQLHPKESAEIVEILIDAGADVNREDKHGSSALSRCAIGGGIKAVRLLLDAGADVNSRSATLGTPLMGAAAEGDLEVVRLLVSQGADVEAVSSVRQTALSIAAKRGHEDVVDFLESVSSPAGPTDLGP
jgi:ankyrin repeat protein